MATPASQTTAATIGKGFALVLCAGLACTVTGGAAAAAGASVLGGIIGTLAGGVAGNLATTFVEKVTSLFGGHMSRATADAPNHDLAALATDAVYHAIGAAHAAVGAGAKFSNAIGRIHAAGPGQVAATLANVPNNAMDEADILAIIGTPEGGNSTPTKTPAFWLWVAGDLAKKTSAHRIKPGADASPLHAVKSIFTITPRPEDPDPNADAAIAWLADYLHRRVANQVNDILRSPTEIGRRARIAAEFMYLRAILEAVRSQGQNVTLAPAQLDAIKAAVAERCEALAKEPAWFTTANAAFALSLREHAEASANGLSALGADVSAIRVSLDKVLAMLAQLAEQMQRYADESRERDEVMLALLREFKEALAGRTRAAPTDNLAAASATQNNNFVGRTKQLNDLAALIQHPTTPTVVVIVAGAGFGKTELAKHFINTRAKAASTNADPAALAPDQWTARWWLDGSKSGEAASLQLHYEAITGQPYTAEPRPAPGEDPAKVAAAFRTSLRKDIAAACSTGKQLLVIDNAETTQQITEYKPGNAGRLIATTRRQPIPKAVGHEFPLDVMSANEARELLAHARPDLQTPAHAAALDAIATHLGHHALALAYAAAALARPPLKAPEVVLAKIQAADIGAEGDILAEFGEDALGTQYKLGLAQSLRLLLDELADPAVPTHEALALDLAELAAFCAPNAIPVSLLIAASGEPEADVEQSLRALHERSIITLTDTVSLHRLTQSLLRGGVRRAGGEQVQATLTRLLDALIDLFRWPGTQAEERVDHEKTPARLAALAHAEAVIVHADTFVRDAGEGAAAPLPRTPTPAMQALAARLRAEMAHRLASVGQLADAARHIDAAIDWFKAQSPRDERSLAINYASRASIRRDRGDLAGAEADMKKSIDWGEAQSPRDERGLAILYASRASILQARGDLAGAEADIKKSIDWGEAQSPRDEGSLAIWYASRASIRQSRGDLAGAEADIQKSIDWEESQTQPSQRELAIRYASRASILQARGDLAGAEADIAKSIEWGEAQSPRDERGLAILYASRASILQARGDLAGAEADIKKSITWGEAQSPRDERGLAIDYASRSSIRQDRGDLAGAEADIKKAIAWYEAQSPSDERGLAILYASRAGIRLDRRDLAGAEDDIKKSIDWEESQTQPNHHGLAICYTTKAFILAKAGKFPEARAAIDESVRLHTAVFGADHEWTKITIRRQQAIHAGKYPG